MQHFAPQRQLSKQYTRLARDASSRLGAARPAADTTAAASAASGARESAGCESSRAPARPPRNAPSRGDRVWSHTRGFSPVYDPSFMGASSRFRMHRLPNGRSAVSRAMLTGLERDRLTHASPSTVNDHLCISMVKGLRWVADRVFRERHVHRATMLKTIAAVPAAAGSVTTFFRLTGRSARESVSPTPIVLPRAAVYGDLGEALASSVSPLPRMKPTQTTTSSSSLSSSSAASPPQPLQRGTSLGDRLAGLDTIRGLAAQAECHTAHHQILVRMAEITPFERFFVLAAQVFQFAFYAVVFLVYPRMGFRLMGYTLEESSVVWTQMINDIDLGKVSERRVPSLALEFWGLEGSFVPQGAPPPVVVMSPSESDSMAAARSPFITAKTFTNTSATPSASGQGSSSSSSTTAAASPQAANKVNTSTEAIQSVDDEEYDGDGLTSQSDVTLTLRDVVLLIRSDEMYYRDACHKMADEIDRASRERSRIPWGQRFIQWAEAWLKK